MRLFRLQKKKKKSNTCQKNLRLALLTPGFYMLLTKSTGRKNYTHNRLCKQADPKPEPIQPELARSSILTLIYNPSLFIIQGNTQP